MIVSYSRKFVFIKTKKTAGSTVEAVLSAACGPGDVIAKPRNGARSEPGQPFYSHMTAEAAHAVIEPDFWRQALKITTERHPYEKAVSQAFYRLHKARKSARRIGQREVGELIDRVVRQGNYAGFPRWSVAGVVAMDEFILLENLRTDLERVGKRLGIAIPEELPRKKSSSRTDRRPAHEILTAEQKDIVYGFCEKEFQLFGYAR